MTDLNVDLARLNMIQSQVRTWDVLDQRITETLATVARESFVPQHCRNFAFVDMQIPLGHGQVMMEPKVEGRMLQTLDPRPDEHALEIGTGSGFITACLSKLAGRVTSVEFYADLQSEAGARLQAGGFQRIDLVTGDAAAGWDDGVHYDVIAVTGSLPELHQGFHRSLSIGGRLFVIVGEFPIMEALRVTRVGENAWSTESLFDTSVPSLENAYRPARFAL